MKILLKKHVNYYRYTVAKVLFLETYKQYTLEKDFVNSNCMQVYDKEKHSLRLISIFGKPPEHDDTIPILPLYIFYQTPNYEKNLQKGIKLTRFEEYEIHKLNDKFEELYKSAIEDAFTNTGVFFDNLSSNHLALFEYYFSEAKDTISDHDIFYKYYSKGKVEKNSYLVNDGRISFLHANKFNDPFDCNCMLSSNVDMSDKFRVLCLAKQFDNILMWSYYADGHRGYCFEYPALGLITAIENITIKGLCVFGDIEYKDKRPKQRSTQNVFSFTDINFYIDAVFAKYSDWNHERECRFVIISKNISEDVVEVSSHISSIYEGCLGERLPIHTSYDRELKTIGLTKSETTYGLETREKKIANEKKEPTSHRVPRAGSLNITSQKT